MSSFVATFACMVCSEKMEAPDIVCQECGAVYCGPCYSLIISGEDECQECIYEREEANL